MLWIALFQVSLHLQEQRVCSQVHVFCANYWWLWQSATDQSNPARFLVEDPLCNRFCLSAVSKLQQAHTNWSGVFRAMWLRPYELHGCFHLILGHAGKQRFSQMACFSTAKEWLKMTFKKISIYNNKKKAWQPSLWKDYIKKWSLPLHLLVVLSKMALVDTILPYLQGRDKNTEYRINDETRLQWGKKRNLLLPHACQYL